MFKEIDGEKAILNPNLNEGVQYIMTIKVFMLDIQDSKNIGFWVCVSNNDSPNLRFFPINKKVYASISCNLSKIHICGTAYCKIMNNTFLKS